MKLSTSGYADGLGHDLAQAVVLAEINWLEADGLGMSETLGVEVADHDDGGAEDAGRGRGREADRACARHIDGRAHSDLGRHGTVKTRRQDVAQHGEVADLGHGLRLVGEAQQVEVGVGHHDVARLPPDPPTHVDIAIGTPGAARVDREANARVTLVAGPAASAGDIERHGHEIALLQHLDVGAHLDHLAGDLVPEHESFRGRGPAADHMLVGTADIGRDDLQDHAMRDGPAVRRFHLGIVDALDLDLVLAEIDHASIVAHETLPLLLLGRE